MILVIENYCQTEENSTAEHENVQEDQKVEDLIVLDHFALVLFIEKRLVVSQSKSQENLFEQGEQVQDTIEARLRHTHVVELDRTSVLRTIDPRQC